MMRIDEKASDKAWAKWIAEYDAGSDMEAILAGGERTVPFEPVMSTRMQPGQIIYCKDPRSIVQLPIASHAAQARPLEILPTATGCGRFGLGVTQNPFLC